MKPGERRRVLVTGAAGYLGSGVVEALAARPEDFAEIVATDLRPVPRKARIPGVTYAACDIRSAELRRLFGEHRIDVVVHLASIVTPPKKMSRAEMRAIDVGGTENVLGACVEHGVDKLIVTSSGAAYGYYADNAPLLTEGCPLRGNAAFPYAAHKREVEELLARARARHPELAQLIFRPGTILGAGATNPVAKAFNGRVVVGIRGAATPFVFIWDQDVVAIIVEGARGNQEGIFNLAGDGVMTLREIALFLGKPYLELDAELLGALLELGRRLGLTRFGREHVDFLRYRPVLGNERLKRVFGYRPRKTTREVLEAYA